VLLLCVVVFLHDAASNLVGTIRDVEGDLSGGYSTVPVVYGVPFAVALAAGLALATVVSSIVLLGFQRAPALSWALFLGSLVLSGWAYVPLWRRRTSLTRVQALTAHKWLVAERLVLICAFLASALAPAVTLSLLAVAVALTISTQFYLRDRYEPQPINRPLVDTYVGARASGGTG
jgi:4-hydroxybenzoate polyprenyltransferase/geranylgeranylglycerol-phosphate geranylgeranyltransferase